MAFNGPKGHIFQTTSTIGGLCETLWKIWEVWQVESENIGNSFGEWYFLNVENEFYLLRKSLVLRVDKGWNTTLKDLESWRFER